MTWIKVEDSLPEIDTEVLVWDDGSFAIGWLEFRQMWDPEKRTYSRSLDPVWVCANYGYDGASGLATKVSHWQPQPGSPDETL